MHLAPAHVGHADPVAASACDAAKSLLDAGVARLAAKRFARGRRERVVERSGGDVSAAGLSLSRTAAAARFEKEKNIVDIWFESGVTHLAVLGRDGMPWPADLVLEGGDQFRGWFRSSLITGVAIKGARRIAAS